MRYSSDLSDVEFALIVPVLPTPKRRGGEGRSVLTGDAASHNATETIIRYQVFPLSWGGSNSTMWDTGCNTKASAEVSDQLVKFLRTVDPAVTRNAWRPANLGNRPVRPDISSRTPCCPSVAGPLIPQWSKWKAMMNLTARSFRSPATQHATGRPAARPVSGRAPLRRR
jgi:hypothetical protein